jgi:hypothetical protein
MANPVLWGPRVWRANFDLAARVDRLVAEQDASALEMAKDMQLLLTVESCVYPSDDCSYFATEYVVACPVPKTLFVDYLYDMKACIDAKIKTVQYDKHQVEECIPPHLSRFSFYKRMQLPPTGTKQDWALLVALGAKHLENHYDAPNRQEAIAALVRLLNQLYAWDHPEVAIVSFDTAMHALQAWHVDLDEIRQFVQLAFE